MLSKNLRGGGDDPNKQPPKKLGSEPQKKLGIIQLSEILKKLLKFLISRNFELDESK